MKAALKMKCPSCKNWNKIIVEKVFLNTSNSSSKVNIFLPAYLPYKEEKCSKCGYIIAREKEAIRIVPKNR